MWQIYHHKPNILYISVNKKRKRDEMWDVWDNILFAQTPGRNDIVAHPYLWPVSRVGNKQNPYRVLILVLEGK